MKVVTNILLKLYAFWVFLVFTSSMILLLPGIVLPFLLGDRFGWIGYKFLWLWAWIFSQLTFIRYEFHGRENYEPGKAYIYVSNHTSFLDAPGLRLSIPGEFRPLGKKELLKIPIFGWIAATATVVVDRSSVESRKRSINYLKRLLSMGISILIFAEGTQNRTDQLLQPFYDGAFRIAVDTQQPILPIVVVGAGRLMPPSTIRLRPGKIKVITGKPIDTTGFTIDNIAELKQGTFATMEKMIRENL